MAVELQQTAHHGGVALGDGDMERGVCLAFVAGVDVGVADFRQELNDEGLVAERGEVDGAVAFLCPVGIRGKSRNCKCSKRRGENRRKR